MEQGTANQGRHVDVKWKQFGNPAAAERYVYTVVIDRDGAVLDEVMVLVEFTGLFQEGDLIADLGFVCVFFHDENHLLFT